MAEEINELLENRNIPDSLFEKKDEDTEEKAVKQEEKVVVPKPTASTEAEPDVTITGVTEDQAEEMLELIKSKNEEGYSPSYIFGTLLKLKDYDKFPSPYEMPEENVETVDEFPIEYCSVDMYSLDGNIMDVVLTFKAGPNDAYLRELNEQLNRYRLMQEKMRMGDEENVKDAAAFTLNIMPTALDGEGLAAFSFPIAFFRALDDDNVSASMHILFYVDNVTFEFVKLSEGAKADIEADVIRNSRNSEGMFEGE